MSGSSTKGASALPKPSKSVSSPLGQESALPGLEQILGRAHLRLILLAVALAAVSLLITGTLSMRAYVSNNLELSADTIAYTIEPAILFDDNSAIAEGVSSVSDTKNVTRVLVKKPSGETLLDWHSAPDQAGILHKLGFSGFLRPKPEIRNITRGPEIIARVTVVANTSAIALFDIIGILIALVCFGLAVVATRILAIRLERDVLQPLSRVAKVAHDVREDRAFSERVPASGIQEIDNFTKDFNALLAELEGWHEGITNENAELTRRATQDSLTGLGNRTLFEQRVNDAIANSVMSGHPFAIVYLDADGFKSINDTYGHEVGDSALCEVARNLRTILRKEDSIFRIGGDEFSLLFQPLENENDLDHLIPRIRKSLDQPLKLCNGQRIILSMSLGCAIYPNDGISPKALLRSADSEMYRDKKGRSSHAKKTNLAPSSDLA